MVSIERAIEDLNNDVIIENPDKEGCTTVGEIIIMLERLQMLENQKDDLCERIESWAFDSERGKAVTVMDIRTEIMN